MGTTPIYKPGPGKLLVRNKAGSLNPVDWKVKKHGMFVEHYPAIVGVDIAGDVEEVGEGITSFSTGDGVYVAFFYAAVIITCQITHQRRSSSRPVEPEFQQYVKTRAVSTTKLYLYAGVLLRCSQLLLQDLSQSFV